MDFVHIAHDQPPLPPFQLGIARFGPKIKSEESGKYCRKGKKKKRKREKKRKQKREKNSQISGKSAEISRGNAVSDHFTAIFPTDIAV